METVSNCSPTVMLSKEHVSNVVFPSVDEVMNVVVDVFQWDWNEMFTP